MKSFSSIRNLLLAFLLFTGNIAAGQYLISIAEPTAHACMKFYVFFSPRLSSVSSDSVAVLETFDVNIFNYILCCEYGTTSIGQVDSLQSYDSLELSAWKEYMIDKYHDVYYDFNRSLNRGDFKQYSYSFKSAMNEKYYTVCVVRLNEISFCRCYYGFDDRYVLSMRSKTTAIKLSKSEKHFFRENIGRLLARDQSP